MPNDASPYSQVRLEAIRNRSHRAKGRMLELVRNYFTLERKLLQSRGHFEFDTYRQKSQQDLSDLDVIDHYINVGYSRGLNPNYIFDTDWYLANNLDVVQSRQNPYAHYLTYGWQEGRSPCCIFDGKRYLELVKERKVPNKSPVAACYAGELIELGPLFDSQFYLSRYPDVARAKLSPFIHYLKYGSSEDRSPNAYFDLEYYKKKYMIQGDSESPLCHYLRNGEVSNFQPSKAFSPLFYKRQYRDVQKSGQSALFHFMKHGLLEGRSGVDPAIGYRENLARSTIQSVFSENLHLKNTIDITCFKEGIIECESSDPQIIIAIEEFSADSANSIGLFEYITNSIDYPIAPRSRLYLDYGLGFSEALAVNLHEEDADLHCSKAFLPFPKLIKALRLDPSERPGKIKVTQVSLGSITRESLPPDIYESWMKFLAKFMRSNSAADMMPGAPNLDMQACIMALLHLNPRQVGISDQYYSKWISDYPLSLTTSYFNKLEHNTIKSEKPFFSIVIPVYNAPVEFFSALIDCLLKQTYDRFEICIADDCSTSEASRTYLKKLETANEKVRVAWRNVNGHISAASNTAAELATGDYIVLVDQDDFVPLEMLELVARYIQLHPSAELIFSDEDKIDALGSRFDPYLKGEFDIYLMYGHNMFSHLGIYKRSLFNGVGGFRIGYEGAQDYDLMLRCYDEVGPSRVLHIPYVLYHWRVIAGSTAMSADQKDYAIVAARKALNDHFSRTKKPYRSVPCPFASGISSIVAVETTEPAEMISIIIPLKNDMKEIEQCLKSIYKAGDLSFEVLIIDNGSDEPSIVRYLAGLARRYNNLRVLSYDFPFNYSAINNFAVGKVRGSIVCLLNNDTEVISSDWLRRARAHLKNSDVGIVGARLLYENRLVQHFGLYTGIGEHGVAGAAYVGIHQSEYGAFAKGRLIQQFSAVTAACLFIRLSCYKEVGGFDESLVVAYNDVDLCMKIRKLGLKVICDPDIELYHKESYSRGPDTSPAKKRRLDGEAIAMNNKWPRILTSDPFYSPNFSLVNTQFELSFPPRLPPFDSGREVLTLKR